MLNSVDAVAGASVSAVDSSSSNEAVQQAQPDIKEFIHAQLKENTRDRLFMLNVERDLINFIKNQKDEYFKFQAMNPYYRMLTHRICEYFGLGHSLDSSRQSVIVFKTGEKCNQPALSFQAIISSAEQKQQDKLASQGSESGSDSSSSSNSLTPNTSSNNLTALQEVKVEKKQILKRDTNDQENLIRNNQLNKKVAEIKPKTFEEKSAEYNRIKNRIFNNLSDNGDTDKASNPPVDGKMDTEVKQYKILNRNGHTDAESGQTANVPSGANAKTQSQKKIQSKSKQTTNGCKKQAVSKNFSTPGQVVHSNYRQMVPQFPPSQLMYMNQNGSFQHQFSNVMFPNVPQAYQIMANQSSGLLMPRAPFLQIPQGNSQTSPVRPSPKTRPKFQSPVCKKPIKANDRIKNIKFQVYNLSADLTRDRLNQLLAPYIFKMEIVDKKTNAVQQNGEHDAKSSLLDEASINILIEFDNFDKIEEAFKDLNLNGGSQSTSPFLIKPVC